MLKGDGSASGPLTACSYCYGQQMGIRAAADERNFVPLPMNHHVLIATYGIRFTENSDTNTESPNAQHV